MASLGQTSGDALVMTGTILDVDAISSRNKSKTTTSFKIQISLQIRNTTKDTYFVLRPGEFFGTRKVEFLSSTGSISSASTIETKPVCISSKFDPCYSSHDFTSAFFRDIEDDPMPKPTMFAKIEPEGYFEFIDTFLVDTGFEFNDSVALMELERQETEFWKPRLERIAKITSVNHAEMERRAVDREFGRKFFSTTSTVERSEFPYLRVEYRLSARQFTKAPDIFLTLHDRWRSFGKLPLHGNDYYIRSGQILNDTRFAQ